MGTWIDVEIKVRTFSDSAKQNVLSIDFKDYDFYGRLRESRGDRLWCSEIVKDNFRGEDIMEALAEGLGKDGYAYIIEKSDEDIPYVNIYYYYGSKVKTVEIDCEDEDGAEFYMAGDFEPSLEWEKKGIAKFTAAEKKMMLRQ